MKRQYLSLDEFAAHVDADVLRHLNYYEVEAIVLYNDELIKGMTKEGLLFHIKNFETFLDVRKRETWGEEIDESREKSMEVAVTYLKRLVNSLTRRAIYIMY
jgi:hypothetical protein